MYLGHRGQIEMACARTSFGVCVIACTSLSCGGSSATRAGTDAGGGSHGDGGVFVEAPHAPFPQLVFPGGPILIAPQVVTVTFAGDSNADALEAFDDDIVASSWWTTVTAGFCDQTGNCIGKGSSGGHVRIPTAPATSYSDSTVGTTSSLQMFILDQLKQGVFPANTPNTLYLLYLPGSTMITLTESSGQSVTTCTQFSGYHNMITPGEPAPISYAVIQECPPPVGSPLTPFEVLTSTASHEILEGATDPIPTAQPRGYALDPTDPVSLPWAIFAGAEAGDLCVDPMALGQDETRVDGYDAQRIWSNANAAKGLDPCIPLPDRDVYFSVAPEGANGFLVLRVGGTATFDADAFSTAATGPWTLTGVDWATKMHLLKAPLLSFFFNGQASATVQNGDKVSVTVTLNADPSQLGSAVGVFLSTTGPANAPTAAHTWPILVVTPSEYDGGL
jgi:hypothetical protein